MARSHYIYILKSEGKVVAAFTVKHELVSHLVDSALPLYSICRVRDGKAHTGVDLTDEIQAEVDAYLSNDLRFSL